MSSADTRAYVALTQGPLYQGSVIAVNGELVIALMRERRARTL